MMTKTTISAKKETVERNWYVIDATDKVLGRLSTEIADTLRGKNKPCYTPHCDTGDHVVVINAEKVKLTGKKMTDKMYFHHTFYPGGERFTSAEAKMAKDPTSLVTMAVKGMLPKNKLGRKILKNLRVYAGPVHQHTAQNPEIVEL
jgi:large subunit ribosomal protein L13